MTKFYDHGDLIEISDRGDVYFNGSLVEEAGTDADFDTHSIDVQNGEGYYDCTGKYISYSKGDDF